MLVDLMKYYILFPSMEIVAQIYLVDVACMCDIQDRILLEALVAIYENTLQYAVYDKYNSNIGFSFSFYLPNIFICVLLSILSLLIK